MLALEAPEKEERKIIPFVFMRRMFEDVERLFEDSLFGKPFPFTRFVPEGMWAPNVDMFEKDGLLTIRADLPGFVKEDVKLEVTEDGIVMTGERKEEKKEEREGYYRAERSYGRFARRIPLPEGVRTDEAKATFKNGVLEVTIPAPKRVEAKSRKLEIKAA